MTIEHHIKDHRFKNAAKKGIFDAENLNKSNMIENVVKEFVAMVTEMEIGMIMELSMANFKKLWWMVV